MEDDKKTNSIGDVEVELNEDEAVKEQLTPNDTPKVKYVNKDFADKNGDAKIDIQNVPLNIGMGKEELMKYANEPAWVRARLILFILFWICWLGMLVGAIVIIVMAPRCAPPPQLAWWQKSVFYNVYVPSFKDADGDGMGDLKGLISKLDYFGKLGIVSLLLSPIFESPMIDNGYDITNFTNIEPKFGNMEDFEMMMSELKKREMKLILDFVPNHSSDQHPWFEASIDQIEPYKNYYIWEDGKNNGPPNNWLSIFGGSAWTYNDKRKQYYFHQFSSKEPDLNLRNPMVRSDLLNLLTFWLDTGVDGFRIDAAPYLFENESLLDEPVNINSTVGKDQYDYLNHIYTKSQPEIYEIIAEWKELMNNYSSTGTEKILMAEAYDTLKNTMLYYGTKNNPLVDIPFNFKLLDLTEDSTARDLLDSFEYWTNAMPEWAWPNWVLGNHDVERLASRVGKDNVDGILMATLLNNGTSITYYADELGMLNAQVLPKTVKDLAFPDKPRDAFRTPMQWSNSTSAGFSNSTDLWLPIQPNYETVNVESEFENGRSYLNIYRSLIKLRGEPAIKFGKVSYLLKKSENVFCMLRIRKGSPGYLIVFNMGNNSSTIDFTDSHENLPDSANVEVRSHNLVTGPLAESGQSKIKLNEVQLGPNESVVLSFVPKFDN